MDLEKVYLIQSITAAANNLRLNPQQIEVVGLLRETITKSEDVGAEFLKMKKSTELSKLAIRLSEIHSFLTHGKVDFVKISEQFKEHSRYLIRDLNQFLENVSPHIYKDSFHKINSADFKTIDVELVDRSSFAPEIMVDKKENDQKDLALVVKEKTDSIMDFERKIIEPIRALDEVLKKMTSEKPDNKELNYFCSILENNATISRQRGLEVITKMQLILAAAFKEISSGSLIANKMVIDALRACLIVIAAVIKKKEVDVNAYLNRAEEFSKKYLKNKIQV